MQEIKECPFCGKIPVYVEKGFSTLDTIRCNRCHVIMIANTSDSTAKEKLIEKWNERRTDE